MSDNECEIGLKPLAEWIESKEGCPPCLVAPLAAYYLGVLEADGENELAEDLKKTYGEGDTLTICHKLDNIKNNVGEATLKQLRNLDCYAQTFKPEDASK